MGRRKGVSIYFNADEIFLMAEQMERNGPYRHFEQRVGNAAPPGAFRIIWT
jgi:hypothetical protein